MPSPTVIPKDSIVLVTGAAGLVGAGTSDAILAAGYKVRAAARTLSKAEPLRKRFDEEYGAGRFEVVHVEDFGAEGAYKAAIKGVSAVVHIAADVSFDTDADAVIQRTVKGIEGLLELAAAEPSVKRFVLTSSRIATFNPAPGDDYKVDNDSYFDAIVGKARTAPKDDPALPVYAYAAGKVEGEKQAFKWVQEHKPSFVFNSVLPDYVAGPIINPANRKGFSGATTASWLNQVFFTGDNSGVLPFVAAPSFYVDVRDVGRIHLAALIEEDVRSERLWALADRFNLNEVLAIWRRRFPDHKLPADFEGLGVSTKIQVDNSRSTELLKRQGREWIDLETVVVDQVKSVL